MTLIRNERLKLAANFLNAIAIGLIGIAVLRPVVETGAVDYFALAAWTLAGLALHALAHYVLGYLR
ncbi:hypothetical protein CG51_18570 [Haematobacter missouriensis]|uniref:Uncharacterized protein n=1 Tax=Haematobacter missouriensis TaxID=366616 RepID=A0A212AJ02_9RHOB|nr:hypothetical protein [Haematobacter missouriensis]KFI24207.1 hypothetical protein CG51_18570 [Haematobacter missouriensis]OWJ74339.1 hypothetical protein CDV53_13845 [Haematobacter missouriensis]OWJ81474.1 hypothetical protein CDV52_18090 [Haematobacter missouriensis]